MKRVLGFAIGGIFLMTAVGAFAQETGTDPGTAAAVKQGCCFNGGGNPPDCNDGTATGDDSGCVSDTKDHAKCSAAIGKAFCGLVQCVLKCHTKQASARFKGTDATTADTAEEACEGNNNSPATEKSCGGKFNKAIAKISPPNSTICDPQQLSNAASESATLIGDPSPIPFLSLDGQNGLALCDSTSGALIGGDDDATGVSGRPQAWVPGGPNGKNNAKCAADVSKSNSGLVCCQIKAHTKANSQFFAGKTFDEGAAEDACIAKFNKTRDKDLSKGICPPCLDQAGWDTNNANVIGTVDGANVVAFPCLAAAPTCP